jgi:hypothetical protein
LIPLEKPMGASKGGFRFKGKKIKIKKMKLQKFKVFKNSLLLWDLYYVFTIVFT